MKQLALLAVALCVSALPLPAQSTRSTDPVAEHGFSPQRLARIDSFFDGLVAGGRIGGGVALVMRDGAVVYERAFGWADVTARTPMEMDAVFRIASQSKAITSVAIMMLAEEGRLTINDPVSRYIPEFRQTTVSTNTDSGRVSMPSARQITLRDLLTHTAGLSYGTGDVLGTRYAAIGLGPAAGPSGWYLAHGEEPICDMMARLPTVPFAAQPGERFVYGYGTDVLGCVVERVAGMPLDQFIKSRITRPLGMHDTHFFLPAAKAARLAVVHAQAADGTLAHAPPGAAGQGHYVQGPRRTFSGGAGMVSTARDYARFMQMLLNGGELDGVRILGPKTVALMTSNQAGTLYSQQGEGFGLGFSLLQQAGARGRVESVGTFGWGGAYGSSYQIDPQEGLVVVYMVQELPGFSAAFDRFTMLVYQALVEPRQ